MRNFRQSKWYLLFLLVAMIVLLFGSKKIAVAMAPQVVYMNITIEAEEYIEAFYPHLYDIIKCESNFDPTAQNPTSSASGILQFIDGTYIWAYHEVFGENPDMADKNNMQLQLFLGDWLYQQSGDSHWQYPCGSLV